MFLPHRLRNRIMPRGPRFGSHAVRADTPRHIFKLADGVARSLGRPSGPVCIRQRHRPNWISAYVLAFDGALRVVGITLPRCP